MKKLFSILLISTFFLSSCEKDETVEAKDYTTHTEILSINSEIAKMIPEVGPPPSYIPTGNNIVDYYFSVQHSFKLSGEFSTEEVVNSSDDYQKIIVTANPNTDLTDILPAKGDWHLMLTEYTTEEVFKMDGKWYVMPLVGVLTNKDVTTANIASNRFDNITLEDAKKETFIDDVDNIGTKWQEYNMSLHRYIILNGTDDRIDASTYLIKVGSNEIYKFRFMDFYGDGRDKGEKGHVTFQYELLK